LCAVPRHALADDGSSLHVQRGEQRGCPMPFVVVRVSLGLPLSPRSLELESRTLMCR
jgi:hypothetical protein